jgi:hypothetical protein
MIRSLLLLLLVWLVPTTTVLAAELPTPWLGPLVPDRVQAGAVLRLEGEHLGETTDEVAVRFVPDLIVATDAWSETTVEVVVPHAAVSGPIQVVVTRELPDGTLFQPQEVYSRERALYSYTMGNAIAAFEEDIKGSITPGKLADITVLSQDLLTVADDEIMDTDVVMTILGGEIRYRDGEIVR